MNDKHENGLINAIDNFLGHQVLILGDLLLDEYIWGDTDRISPEAPVPVVNIKKREIRPGGAANVAMTIAALGGTPVLAGVVGDDDTGRQFTKNIELNGITKHCIIEEPGRITPLKTRILASNQQMLRIDNEQVAPISKSSCDKLTNEIAKILEKSDALLISDYAKGVIGSGVLAPVLDKAKSLGIIITVDPKPVNINLYRGVTLVSPNLKETSSASGVIVKDRQTLKESADVLMDKITPKALLVTRGAEGLSLYLSDGSEHHLPAVTSQVYDVSGAGDTMIGTLTLAMASGINMLDSTIIANCAAGVVVKKPGVATVSPDELKNALGDRSDWE